MAEECCSSKNLVWDLTSHDNYNTKTAINHFPYLFFFLNIIINSLLLMFWNTCDYQRLCLYCNSRLGQI